MVPARIAYIAAISTVSGISAGGAEVIPLFSPSLSQEELAQIANSFETGWIGKGRKVEEFEAAWARHIGVSPDQVVSVNCATEGLFQIFDLIREEWNDWYSEVILPSVHFVGVANAITSSFAKPIFCDVDRHTLNPTLEYIQKAYTSQTKSVCLLHYGGVAQELDTIREWCNDRGLWLIEDAACSPATVYKGKAAGTWGHFGVWSFDAMKILSTGDGGMIYCENPDHARELRKRLYLGMNNENGLKAPGDRWWEFEVTCPGRRAVMNDIAAGMGLEQLKKVDKFINRRVGIAMRYYKEIGEVVRHPSIWVNAEQQPSFYFYWIQTPRRDDLAKFLRAKNVYVTFRYWPLHYVFKTGESLPNAEWAAQNTLLLPLHCNLTHSQIGYICDKVKEYFK